MVAVVVAAAVEDTRGVVCPEEEGGAIMEAALGLPSDAPQPCLVLAEVDAHLVVARWRGVDLVPAAALAHDREVAADVQAGLLHDPAAVVATGPHWATCRHPIDLTSAADQGAELPVAHAPAVPAGDPVVGNDLTLPTSSGREAGCGRVVEVGSQAALRTTFFTIDHREVARVADLAQVILHCVPAARAAMACGLVEMVD